MSELFEPYLPQHEVLRSMLMSSVMWGLGDVMAQLIERYTATNGKQPSSAPSASPSSASLLSFYQPLRTVRLALYAFAVFAPATHYWFQFLEHLFPGSGLVVAVKRMLLDQTLYAPCVISSLFIVVGALEGLSVRSVLAKTRDGFLPTLTRNWLLWPAAQLGLQGFVPVQHRLFVANCINLPWTAYLAYRASQTSNAASSNSASSTAGGGGGKSVQHHVVSVAADESDDEDDQLGELIDEQ